MQDSVLKIGDIRLLCRQHFEQTGDKLSFLHAYRMAAARQRHAFPTQLRIPEDSILSVKDFTAFTGGGRDVLRRHTGVYRFRRG